MLKLFSATSRRCHPKLFLPTPRIGKTVTGDAYHETQPSLPAKHHTTTEPIINSAEPTELVADNSWPEWVNLLGQLSEQGYIEPDTPGDVKNSNKIRTACLNFARDRFDFIRYFSNKDLKVTVRHGCPSLDRKVVNSGKRLRAHLGIDEGSVCRSCFLRGNCERAYVKALKDDGAQTVDVMRVLITYGLHSVTRSVENKPCLNKEVEESARRLMKHMAEFKHENADTDSCNFSSVWSSSVCENLVPQRKDQRNFPIKQGDWICPKCHFLNFAKNTRCLQCKEMPLKRALNPGEWECDSCNFINFRKNMVCLKCDYRRLKTSKAAVNSMRLLRGNGAYSADYETCQDLKETHYHYSDRWSQNKDAPRRNFCENERHSHDSLQPVRKNSVVSRLPIIRGCNVSSRDIQEHEGWREDGAEGNSVRVVPNVENPATEVTVALDCPESADDDMSSWFARRRKI
uniref:RanBP2-type domain-containing protein n=2 Tax=Kalanchoe fedtschenkoi TaxID=63787 RepID=A0A7N0TL24_KALFE